MDRRVDAGTGDEGQADGFGPILLECVARASAAKKGMMVKVRVNDVCALGAVGRTRREPSTCRADIRAAGVVGTHVGVAVCLEASGLARKVGVPQVPCGTRFSNWCRLGRLLGSEVCRGDVSGLGADAQRCIPDAQVIGPRWLRPCTRCANLVIVVRSSKSSAPPGCS